MTVEVQYIKAGNAYGYQQSELDELAGPTGRLTGYGDMNDAFRREAAHAAETKRLNDYYKQKPNRHASRRFT